MFGRMQVHRWLMVVGLTLVLLVIPLGAQDDNGGSSFSTNTPQPTQQPTATLTPRPTIVPLATNTPVPTTVPMQLATNTPLPTALPLGPQGPIGIYGLRLLLEQDVLDILIDRLHLVDSANPDTVLAVELLLYELTRRFPIAPSTFDRRERLVQAMLATPRGTLDMRSMIRPYIEAVLNQEKPAEMNFSYAGFAINTIALNLDGRDAIDALVHIRYPIEGEALYEDYVLALRDAGGNFRFLPNFPDFFAVPFNGVESITLERIGDVNRDTLENVVLRLEDGDPNDLFLILAYRNDRAVQLNPPDSPIRVGTLVQWNTDNNSTRPPILQTIQVRRESDQWGCFSELPVDWEYVNNFYRPQLELNARFTPEDSLECALAEGEPYFDGSPAESVERIQNILVEETGDDATVGRALILVAMLQLLNFDLSSATETAEVALTYAESDDDPLAQQANTLLSSLGQAGSTPLDICHTLNSLDASSVCDVNAVITRTLNDAELTNTQPLNDQLEALGFTPLRRVRVSEIGRADRIAIDLTGTDDGWWSFGVDGGIYQVEKIAPPDGLNAVSLPATVIDAPQSVIDALTVDDDPNGALSILTTLLRNNPDLPLTEKTQYLLGLSYDLVGNRGQAREYYYNLWASAPTTLWGKLAGVRLEAR